MLTLQILLVSVALIQCFLTSHKNNRCCMKSYTHFCTHVMFNLLNIYWSEECLKNFC